MKITYLSGSILPSKSASSVHVMKMCEAFAQEGHDVTLVASKARQSEYDNIYNFYDVNNIFSLKLAPLISNSLSFLFRIFYCLKEVRKADLVYSRWPIAAFVVDKLYSNKDIIIEDHSPPTSIIKEKVREKNIKSEDILAYIFVTKQHKKYFIDKYSDYVLKNINTFVLPDGATPVKNNNSIKKKDNKLACGYIGSFNPGKGIDLVLEIANKLPSVKFHIVGGSERQINKKKKKIKANNIIWYGFLPNCKAMKVLEKEIDIALLPNQSKVLINNGRTDIGQFTSPMKLFEYMAYGKAIISSNLSVLKEVLKDNSNAILVNPRDVNQWVNAISNLRTNKDLFEKISSQAKKDLEQKYSWQVIAKKIVKIIEGLK